LCSRRGACRRACRDRGEHPRGRHRAPHILPVDLSARRQRRNGRAGALRTHLEPAFLVNNAGYGLLGQAAKLDRAEQARDVDLNCRSLTDLSLRFINSLAPTAAASSMSRRSRVHSGPRHVRLQRLEGSYVMLVQRRPAGAS